MHGMASDRFSGAPDSKLLDGKASSTEEAPFSVDHFLAKYSIPSVTAHVENGYVWAVEGFAPTQYGACH